MSDQSFDSTNKSKKGTKLKTQIVKDFEVSREKLGSGSYASVWKGWHRTQKDLLAAVKVISLGKISARLHGKIDSEIQILKGLRHPNVVQLYDVKRCEKYIILILEYCGGGDLSRYIRDRRRPGQGALSEDNALHFMRQLAQGMYFLHSRNLVHRDIKPQNLLLSSADPSSAILKIADFGFARYLGFDPGNLDLAKTLCGSPVYMAPEILSRHNYGANVDLWSAGAVLYEMLFGDPPFRGDTLLDLQRNVEKGLQLPPLADHLSSQCVDLLKHLLQGDPEDRISWQDFFCHPFLYQEGMYEAATIPVVSSSPLEPTNQGSIQASMSSSGLSALMLRKGSISIETQTSPVESELTFQPKLTEEDLVNLKAAAEDQVTTAGHISEVAQQALAECGYNEAYLLYQRVLQLLLDAAKKTIQIQTVTGANLTLKNDITEKFEHTYSSASKVAALLKQHPCAAEPQPAEQLIMNHAVQHAGADGVVEEMLGNFSTAREMYTKGKGLLQYLWTLPTLEVSDKVVVQRLTDAFDMRIQRCSSAEGSLEDAEANMPSFLMSA